MGSMRSHLVRQFLMESTLVALFSFCVAVVIAYLMLPLFNYLSQKQLELPFNNPVFYLILVGSCLLIGLMAGLYPSFFLSAFKPVNVLKGHVSLGMKSGAVRSSLVVFQFVISIFLIVGAIAVNRQLNFIQNKKLLIVADGALQYVPFASLRSPNSKVSSSKLVEKYLIETNEIVSLPSVSTLAILRKETTNRQIPTKTLVVLADPIFDKNDERFQKIAKRKKAKTEFVAVSNVKTRSADFS